MPHSLLLFEVRELLGESVRNVADVIILIGGIASALYAVYKVIAPFTNWGKKLKERKKQKRIQEFREVTENAITSFLDNKFAEKFEPIEGSIIILSDHIKEVDGKISAIISLNQEQSSMLNDLDLKVDDNEIDRIRWEILAFAKSCRHHQDLGLDDFNHIFDLHEKYEALLEERGKTNGQIDVEFQFISNYYIKLSEEGKI